MRKNIEENYLGLPFFNQLKIYDKFLDTAAKTGARIGSTLSNMTSATAEFAKLGSILAKTNIRPIIQQCINEKLAFIGKSPERWAIPRTRLNMYSLYLHNKMIGGG